MNIKTTPERRDIRQKDRWDLTPLFASDSEWEAFFAEVTKDIARVSTYRDRLTESLEVLKEAIQCYLDLMRRLERLYTYAHLKSDENRSNQLYLALNQKALHLLTRFSEQASFLTPQIQNLPKDIVERCLQAGSWVEYRFFLEKILRFKPHTRTEAEERILAMSRGMADAASQVFGQLDNADLRFGTLIDTTTEEIELSHGNFNTFMISPDREVRKRAFFQYYGVYDQHKHTLAAALAGSVQKDLFYAKVRRFASCRQHALFADNVPESVYDNLIRTVTENLDPLFRYLSFRREALGLAQMHIYDTYVPLVADVEFEMPYEEAVDVCVSAVAPLGRSYCRIMREGLLGGWVDRYENRGKRSGAYSGGCYDSSPYILLNYNQNDINSLYTLIHEAGHAMHSFLSNRARPYVDHEYSIFVAEVASTFNEDLLNRYLLARRANQPQMRSYILNREIDNIRATLFRQTMFAEFEKIIHHLAEDYQPLTLEVFTGTYRRLLGTYFGDSLLPDDELSLECLRIPHFYSAFYVYKYATGVSAAVALADNVVSGGNAAREAYLRFLELGGSMFPLDELRVAGVDMGSPEPVVRTIRHFGRLVDQLVAEFQLPAG